MPKDDPIHNAPTDRQLRDAIYNQIARSHVIVIPTGMYSTHSKWIRKEIDGANQYRKPILGVNPHGQLRRSTIVQEAAREVVGWNKKPIIDAIWKMYGE